MDSSGSEAATFPNISRYRGFSAGSSRRSPCSSASRRPINPKSARCWVTVSINEHVAYLTMQSWTTRPDFMTPRSYHLAAYALTGFANFSSVGIQLGGIGAMAPNRRHDLARLGLKALFVGFVATLLNASIAGFFSNLSG